MKNLIRLICLSLILLTTYASADITIDGNTIHVETNNYKVQFDRGVITQLHNKLTDDTYTRPPQMNRGVEGETGILKRNESIQTWHAATFIWTRDATEVETRKIDTHIAETVFRRGGDEIRILIEVDSQTGDLLISGDCRADSPVVLGIQWGIGHLDLSNLDLILPSRGGQVINASTGIKGTNFYYPSTYWEAQLAILQAERGGFYVRGTDETFQFKELNYRSDAGEFSLGFRTHNQAPWDALTSAKSVTWRLNTYAGDWCVPAQIYRDWMEGAFDPWRLSDMSTWVQDIGLVVLHTGGSGVETGTLKGLAEQVDPTKTLLYLTDWREYDYDVNLPNYTPKEELGGFVKAAHQFGYRVMLHVNIYAFSTYHPLYSEFQQFQMRYPWNGELAKCRDETDHPRCHAFISLASSKFRNLLVQSFKAVWEQHNIDAFHLDVSHYLLNDANGLIEGITSAQGSVLLHLELAEAMPGVVFSGENLHEVTFFRESFAQRTVTEAKPNPISAFLFSPYTSPYAYLGVKALEDPEYHTMLDSYEGRGMLPTVSIWKESVLDRPLTRQMLSVVRQWQDLGLKPDITCDWGPDILFQYTTQTGEIATYQRKPSGSVFILPDSGGYERVFNVTQAQTDRGLAHWRGYNETHLIGLDPSRAYFLNDTPRDLSQVRVSSLSPDVYISETRVTDHAALFRFESTGSDRETTVDFSLPTPPVRSIPDTLRHTDSGQYTVNADLSQPVVIFLTPFQQISLPHNLRTAQFATGLQFDGVFRLGSYHSSGDLTTITVDNVSKETISAHPPVDGQTILQFPLLLPEAPSTFSFSAGLAHPDGKGFLCQVRVNGQTYFEAFKDTVDWTNGDISLSAFAGQPMVLELVTAPVQAGGAGADWDWAHWADLHITAAPNPDANLDGRINVLDLILVAQHFTEQPPSNPLADTNTISKILYRISSVDKI